MNSSSAPCYALVVKQDCATCRVIESVINALAAQLKSTFTVYTQDDPSFPAGIENLIDDTDLAYSYRNRIEIVPTLIRLDGGKETARLEGWVRKEWQAFTGIKQLGADLVDFKPGCGSLTQEPGMLETLELRYDAPPPIARQLDIVDSEDTMEACFDRGWTDGLPVVPPTPLRVLRMLKGTARHRDEIIGRIPPDYADCTIEKAAINAVMAGCKPEYFPTVLASIEAALQDKFCLHGLLCTTYFSSPVIIVNGPEALRIGMNSGVNALGQGNRANATIGRTIQLLVRNVGGGVPGGIDRATLGTPGKYTFCFAENESYQDWPTLAMDRGFAREESVVSLFAGDGIIPVVDQHSRRPESLTRSLAHSMRSLVHSKLYMMADAILVLSPEHLRMYLQARWSKPQLKEALFAELRRPGAELVLGAGEIEEGMPLHLKDKMLNKFRDDGLHIVTAGGGAGMFSAIIGGWVASGERGSQLVSKRL